MSQGIKEIRIRLAKNVHKYREARKIGREKLSLAIGMDNSYISKVEKGSINVTIDVVEAIAKYLEVDILDLFKKS